MQFLKRLLTICVAAAFGIAAVVVALVPVALDLSAAGDAQAEPINLDPLPERSLVYDSQGNLLTTLHAEENRSPVALDKVPDTVKSAVLAVEDENFYSHSGVNLKATVRALFTNVESGGVEQGGSTITMQLVKNALLTPERSLSRKTREAVLARRLEDSMTKDQILERYLNTVYFGNGAYGVQAAAELYFNKDVSKLDWPEAALLAALIRDPSDYDPFLHPDLAIERRRIALGRLVEVGKITKQQADIDAFAPLPSTPSTLAEPPKDYFIEEVKQRLLDDPQFNLGDDYTERYNAVFKGGLRIYTTLNPQMQAAAVDARDSTLPSEDGVAAGEFVIRGAGNVDIPTTCPALNDGSGHCLGTVAMVSVEPSSGAVRDLVGGPGFENWKYDLATQAQRQPGSSMKTFVLAAALENGIVVNDTISGGNCSFNNPGATPNPYVVKGEAGTQSLDRQLAGSVNCAYLRLGQVVGLDKVIDQAHSMGVTAPLNPNLSLPLGTDPISPLEMAGAYASIANEGVYNAPYFVDKITDADGKVIYEHQSDGTRVMAVQSARQAEVALQAVVTGGTGTAARLSDRPAAGKTGTTEKHGDAWFVGFTPQLATAVWMGSPEAQVPMNNVGGINVFGGTFPARVWHSFMTEAMAGLPSLTFTAPAPTRPGKFLTTPKGKETGTGTFRPTSSGTPTTRPSGGGGGTTTTTAPGGGGGPPSTDPPVTTAPPATEPPITEPPPTTAPAGP